MYFRALMSSNWNILFFIARKLQRKQRVADSIARKDTNATKPISRIAVLSIALAMIVNIVTIAVVTGFQQEVSRKVIGFGAHISIHKLGESTIRESAPLVRSNSFEQALKNLKDVTSVQSVAYIPALMQSRGDVAQKEILGVVLKGVDNSYDWTFFKEYLVAGDIPTFKEKNSNEILISSRMARDLHYDLSDTLNAFFVKQKPIQRQFKIVGIYETGLEDFDKELAFCYLPQVQQLNDWGISAEIVIDDTLVNGDLIVRAVVSGGNGNYRYNWGKGFEKYSGFQFCPTKDTTIRLIAADYWERLDEKAGDISDPNAETAIADTAYLQFKITGNKTAICEFKTDSEGILERKYLADDGYTFTLDAGTKKIQIESFPGSGSYKNYVGAYELGITDFDQIDAIKKAVKKTIMFNPNMSQQVQVNSIKDTHEDLFVWLDFLDVNLTIILLLMLLIGIVNMGSALLVIILVRTNFIGIFKAMGAPSTFIRRLFIIHIGKLILLGMIIGNVLGITLCFLQSYFHIIPLDPKVYYLNTVPVDLNIQSILILNTITFLICVIAMILPSFVISRISPAKSIRFK